MPWHPNAAERIACMPFIQLRPFRRDDIAIYKSLRLAALRDHPECFGSAYEDVKDRTDAQWLEQMKNVFDGDNAIMFLATDDGQPAGMLNVVRDAGAKVDHYAAIYGVYVRPESRG